MTDISVYVASSPEPQIMRDGSLRALVDVYARLNNPFGAALITSNQMRAWLNSGITNSGGLRSFRLSVDLGLTFIRATEKFEAPANAQGTEHWLDSFERERQWAELDKMNLEVVEDAADNNREANVLEDSLLALEKPQDDNTIMVGEPSETESNQKKGISTKTWVKMIIVGVGLPILCLIFIATIRYTCNGAKSTDIKDEEGVTAVARNVLKMEEGNWQPPPPVQGPAKASVAKRSSTPGTVRTAFNGRDGITSSGIGSFETEHSVSKRRTL